MSECADQLKELLHDVEIVLDEDLQAFCRTSERSRIERYNSLKADEEEFVWVFTEECADFLTDAERGRIRGQFRLSRLLIAASFYSEDGSVPRAMEGDFVEPELQAIVDFDRYRQFDALSEAQIERKIRRMEGEVYELVTEYTSTQLATIDELIEHPDVQQDVMERLLDRYEQRREKIRQGFFTYVETHGLEHTVETIADAVTAVNDASTERERIQEELRSERKSFTEEGKPDVQRFESEIERVKQELSRADDTAELESRIETLENQLQETTQENEKAESEISARIERTGSLEERIEAKIGELQEQKEETETADASEEARKLVESELENLQEQREQVQTELRRLKREREQATQAKESLNNKQEALEEQISSVQQSLDTGDGMEGSAVITAKMARLFEMDYLGRFETAMHDASTIRTADGLFEVPEEYWKERSERRSDRSQLVSLLSEDQDPTHYPENAASRFEITSSGYLGLGSATDMVLEARVVTNLHAYIENGFNANPAGLDAVLSIVNEAVAEAESHEFDYILSLASPTGWSERVQSELLEGDLSTTRYSQYLSLCLVDLQTGAVRYDESDQLLRENVHLFELQLDSERIEDCIETVRTEYIEDIGQESVLLRDVIAEYGYDQRIVKKAFNRLENKGAGEQLYLDELGLSLNVGT